jgi:hypothetical protein
MVRGLARSAKASAEIDQSSPSVSKASIEALEASFSEVSSATSAPQDINLYPRAVAETARSGRTS